MFRLWVAQEHGLIEARGPRRTVVFSALRCQPSWPLLLSLPFSFGGGGGYFPAPEHSMQSLLLTPQTGIPQRGTNTAGVDDAVQQGRSAEQYRHCTWTLVCERLIGVESNPSAMTQCVGLHYRPVKGYEPPPQQPSR